LKARKRENESYKAVFAVSLQWGRAVEGAETQVPARDSHDASVASMGPRR